MDESIISRKDHLINDCGIKNRNDSLTEQLLNYEAILNEASIIYVKSGYYLVSADDEPNYNWIFHISVIRQQIIPLLKAILPLLSNLKTKFSIPESSGVHAMLLDGGLGYHQIGKIVTIYPKSYKDAITIAARFIELTKTYSGPVIPSAFPLGGNLYTNLVEEQFSKSGIKSERWPFANIIKKRNPKQKKWIKQYLVVQQVKGDAKGKVLKCLNLNNWLNIQWCVIKQGLAHQCADNYGRTIKDRLKWQFELLNYHEASIPLPKAISYFEHDNDAYLVTELIKGVSLNERIESLHQGTFWPAIPVESQRQLLKYLIEITGIIDKFHGSGLVHRDINPGNFMVREDGTIIAIDIELAYDLCSNEPLPPYAYGTPGYISPQQQQMQEPDIEDDIYGLGALFLKVLTGISPGKLIAESEDELFKNLVFFIGNGSVASMINSCLKHDRLLRPSLKSIHHSLEVYDVLLLTNASKQTSFTKPNLEQSEIKKVIQMGINAFSSAFFQNDGGYWLSKCVESDAIISNELIKYEWEPGFANGVCGIIYLFAIAEKTGFNTVDIQNQIFQNYELLNTNSKLLNSVESGLYQGYTGVAVAANAMIISGLLENSINNHNLIYQWLNNKGQSINLADGLTGQGIAMLNCSNNTQLPSFYDQLSSIVNILLNEQNSDGSWSIKKDESQRKGIKLYGFSYGIAGINYFLIEYYAKYEDQRVKNAVSKSLNWMLKQRQMSNGNLTWPISSINTSIDPWIEFGFSGIALTFIKGFEIFGDKKYKEAATSALLTHPKYISSNYLCLGNGLSGLGEVYLEAYNIFKDEEWKQRADHIVNLLLHCVRRSTNFSAYWLDGNETNPTGGFMYGNSGIIHFLIRYLNQHKVSFPL